MTLQRRLFRWRTASWKALAFLVLVSFCASSLPLPLVTLDLPSEESAQAYPCQHSVCGCKSARQCWTACCCNSPKQRFAWAKRHGVTPPAYAILESPPEILSTSSSCCKPSKTPGTKTPNIVETRSCCAIKGAAVASASQATSERHISTGGKRRLILTLAAQRCQGNSTEFSVLPWTVLWKAEIAWIQFCSELGWSYPTYSKRPWELCAPPDTPPPRCA